MLATYDPGGLVGSVAFSGQLQAGTLLTSKWTVASKTQRWPVLAATAVGSEVLLGCDGPVSESGRKAVTYDATGGDLRAADGRLIAGFSVGW